MPRNVARPRLFSDLKCQSKPRKVEKKKEEEEKLGMKYVQQVCHSIVTLECWQQGSTNLPVASSADGNVIKRRPVDGA